MPNQPDNIFTGNIFAHLKALDDRAEMDCYLSKMLDKLDMPEDTHLPFPETLTDRSK
jgi:hypothetical protein